MHLVTEPKTILQVNVVTQSQLAQEFLQKDYHDKIQVKNEEKHLEKGVKKSLIIVSHGRSGSSLVGDIFNRHPSVFYMYEPLQTVMRVFNRLKRNDINSVPSYWDLAKEFLDAVLRCTILKRYRRFLPKTKSPSCESSHCITTSVSTQTIRSKVEAQPLSTDD